MEFVQRVLAKTTGIELSDEELELVAGGMKDPCPDHNYTYIDGANAGCDWE